jgi:hypothetical protein
VTYDPDLGRRKPNYAGWIIGLAAVTAATIIGIFAFFARNDTNSTVNGRADVTTVPGPKSGMGTAGTRPPATESGKATAGNPTQTTGSR